jgi:hypothetical protein
MKRLAIGKLTFLPYLLILAVAIVRLSANHPYQFVPIFTCLIFFGACRPKHEFGIAVLGLIGLDIFVTTHHYNYALTPDHVITWMWYLGAVNLGALTLGNAVTMRRVLGSSLSASISFFVVSNFAFWVNWTMYPKTLGGLATCYIAALPFFRNSIFAEVAGSLLIYAAVRSSEALMPAAGFRHTQS